MVHPADVLPLSLSVAIIVQGLIFLTVQGIGLHSVLVDSCRAIGQLVFPGKVIKIASKTPQAINNLQPSGASALLFWYSALKCFIGVSARIGLPLVGVGILPCAGRLSFSCCS